MKYKDYYAALDVSRDADLTQIKKSYRQLARKYHPDASKAPDAEARFKEIAEAYAVLKDADKRAAYDRLGHPQEGAEFAPPPQWQQEFGEMNDSTLADLFASLGQGYTRKHRTSAPAPGRDYENTVRISLEEANQGTSITLNLMDTEGSRTLEVTIPPGVCEGQKLRLRGKGGKGRYGGPNGDIYLHIVLLPHPVFRVDHYDLYFDLALTPWEAALGAEIEVPTLKGPVLLTVPPGTSSGHKLRMRGRGLTKSNHGHGDLYAWVLIKVGTTLPEHERRLYRELSQISNFHPRVVAGTETHHED